MDDLRQATMKNYPPSIPHPHFLPTNPLPTVGTPVPGRRVRLRDGAQLDGVLHRPPARDARGLPGAEAAGAVPHPLHQPGGV